jgi:hypothetical protein
VTDARFFGILALFAISLLVIGFIVGWAANPNGDD